MAARNITSVEYTPVIKEPHCQGEGKFFAKEGGTPSESSQHDNDPAHRLVSSHMHARSGEHACPIKCMNESPPSSPDLNQSGPHGQCVGPDSGKVQHVELEQLCMPKACSPRVLARRSAPH